MVEKRCLVKWKKTFQLSFLLYHCTPTQELQDASRQLFAPLGSKINSTLEYSCSVRFHQSCCSVHFSGGQQSEVEILLIDILFLLASFFWELLFICFCGSNLSISYGFSKCFETETEGDCLKCNFERRNNIFFLLEE